MFDEPIDLLHCNIDASIVNEINLSRELLLRSKKFWGVIALPPVREEIKVISSLGAVCLGHPQGKQHLKVSKTWLY